MTAKNVSLNDLPFPERADGSGLSSIMEQFQAEIARCDAFTREWSSEIEALQSLWSDVHEDLTATETDLAAREAALAQQQREQEQERDRFRQSGIELAQIRTDLQVYRNRVSELEHERNDYQAQRDAIAEEMTAISDLIDLVKSTQDELSAAREETLQRRQQQWEECQQTARGEVVRLQSRNSELEQELIELRGSTETMSERLRHQDDELQGYRTRWNAELGKLQELFAKRSDLLERGPGERPPISRPQASAATMRSKATPKAAPAAPATSAPPPSPETVAVSSPSPSATPEVAQAEDGTPSLPPPSAPDPVVGSVLAAFARLGGKTK